MSGPDYPRIASLRTPEALQGHLDQAGLSLRFDPELADPASSPLALPFDQGGVRVGNRFCILPMEGWDGTVSGEPSPLTLRRWENFGTSGAKLIWGGEAVAVRADGRANPHQLLLTEQTQGALARLREHLVGAHRRRLGPQADGDLLVGLQWWLRDVWIQTLKFNGSIHTFPKLGHATGAVAQRIQPAQGIRNVEIIDQVLRWLSGNVQEALALEIGLLKLAL